MLKGKRTAWWFFVSVGTIRCVSSADAVSSDEQNNKSSQ